MRPAVGAIFAWAALSIGGIVVGALGPWATVGGLYSVNGTAGDGWFVIAVAAIAAINLVYMLLSEPGTAYADVFRDGPSLVFVGLVATVIAWFERSNLSDRIDDTRINDLADVGWGLNLTLVSAASLTLSAIVIASPLTPGWHGALGADVAQPASEPVRSGDAHPDALLAQLQALADLHGSGALTDSEFQAIKQRLLGAHADDS